MFPIFPTCLVFAILSTVAETVTQRLKPQCRSNVCDDRPECPRVSCNCLFASRKDCSIYYKCANGKPYQYKCSPGLLFNVETLSCDYSYNVNCSFSTTVSTSVPSTTNKTTIELITIINTTTETTQEPTTHQTTKLHTSTETIEEPTSTHTIILPTNSQTTKKPTTTETTKESFTTQTTEEPTTTETTNEPTTSKVREGSSATQTTEEPTTAQTIKPTSIETTIAPTRTKTTSEPTTTQTTKEPTTTEIASEPSTTKESNEPTTTQSTKEPTTTEITSEPSTTKVTNQPTTTQTTKKLPTTETTTETITTKTTKEPATTQTTKEQTTTEPTTTQSTKELTTIQEYSTYNITEYTKTDTTTKVPTTATMTETTATISNSSVNPISSTTGIPSSDFLCPTRFGLFPDPKSCFRFYHCSHWMSYHKWCPSDLHFNPKLKVCDWPYRAGCDIHLPTPLEPDDSPTTQNPNDTSQTNDTSSACDCECCELPDPSDCNAYVLCINKVAFKMLCSPDLYFNPMTGTCDHKENVVCTKDDFKCPKPYGRYLLPGSCSYFIECFGGKKNIRKCPEGLQFNQSSEMCSWLGSCSGQQPDSNPGSEVVTNNTICNRCDYCFKPIKKDCSRYIKCLQNTTTEEHCADGLFFNPDSEMCDHDYNVECLDPQPQPVCPQDFGYFPYPGECGLYLQCTNGSVTVKSCPGILHFDPVKKHCEYPWAAGCNNSDSIPTPAPTLNETECDCDCCLKPLGTDCRSFVLCINKVGFVGTCSSGLHFNLHTENCDFAENVECPISPELPGYFCPEHQGLFPHPDDCHKFIHCAHGFPYIKDCPSNLHFNPKLKVCDWPYSAGCQDSLTTDPPMDSNDISCDVCDSCFLPDKTNCASYIFCQKGKGYRLRCTESLLFNPEIEACDLANNVKCPNQPISQCLKPDGLFTAKDCSQFIHCSNGIAYLKDCPDGLYFNPQTLACDWPENVKCGEIPVQPTSQEPDSEVSNVTCNCDCCFLPLKNDCSKYILCLDDYAHIGQCSRGLLFNPSIQNCDLAERVTCGEESPLCPESNGLFPKSDQCSFYVKCAGGIAEVEDCPNGTHFSVESKQCLDPCKAKCDTNYDCSTKPGDVTTTPMPSICLSPNGYYPATNDCTSYFVCSNGQPQRVKCPYGWHYNAEYEVCEDPCDAKCDLSLECKSSTGTNPKTTLSSTSSSTTSSSTPDPQCLQGDGLYPVTTDCSSFYQCSNGRVYLKKCSSGLHFSSTDQACEYPCEAKCNSSIDCSTPGTSATPTSSSTPSSSTPDPQCLQGDGLYPITMDCSSFYQCSNGKAHLKNCSSGLHFSSRHQACEYPCEAKCNTSIDCSTTPKPVSTPSLHCSSGEGLYTVPDNCEAFYLCSNGIEYLIPCPPGQHFSEKHEICENPCLAQCNTTLSCEISTKPVPSSTTEQPLSPECEEIDGLFPNLNDCGSFYQCSNGRSHLMNCSNGLHFSPDDAACERPCVAGCDMNIDCPPEYPDTKGNCSCEACYLPDPSDCSAYYFCDNGRLAKGYCPYGTLFSKVSSQCEDESTVNCEGNGDPSMCPERFGFFPYPGDCKKFIHCDNGVARVKNCYGDSEYDPISRVCTKPKGNCGDIDLDPNCPEPTGMFPDPTNCSLFYHCENGVAYHKKCSAPLMFNSDQEVCDWPENVACGKSTTEISTPAVSPNSTSPSTKPSDQTPSTSPCYEVPGVICPCACRVPTYDECSSYFQCLEDGTACERYCPEGLYFNKIEMVCDLPENVECRDFFFSAIRRAKQIHQRYSTNSR